MTYLELRARPVTAGSRRAVEHQEVLAIVVIPKGDCVQVGGIHQKLVVDAQADLQAVVGHAPDVRVAGLVHGRELRTGRAECDVNLKMLSSFAERKGLDSKFGRVKQGEGVSLNKSIDSRNAIWIGSAVGRLLRKEPLKTESGSSPG